MKYSNFIAGRAILEKYSEQKLPAKCAYKLAEFFAATEKHKLSYYSRVNNIMVKYAEQDSSGNLMRGEFGGIKIKEELIEECRKKIKELNEREESISFQPLTIDDLSPLEFTISEMTAILPFIREG